jgi:hypothetical protein
MAPSNGARISVRSRLMRAMSTLASAASTSARARSSSESAEIFTLDSASVRLNTSSARARWALASRSAARCSPERRVKRGAPSSTRCPSWKATKAITPAISGRIITDSAAVNWPTSSRCSAKRCGSIRAASTTASGA